MKKLLLVEDDPFLTEIYVTKFEQAGYSVEVTDNGEDALQKAKTINPAILLLDIVIPKMSGLEVLKALKENAATSQIPVVVLSNLGSDDDIQRALDIGADAYLIKSQHTPSEVVARVEDLLKK